MAGPAAIEEIRALIATGALPHDPMVVQEGGTQWRPLSAWLGAPPPPPMSGAPTQPNWVATSLKDAAEAFKFLVTNPVGGVSPAFEKLGPARAQGAGVVYGVVFALCYTFFFYRILATEGGQARFWSALGISIVPFCCLVIATSLVRMIFRGRAGFGQDVYVAGTSLLPFALAALVIALSMLNESPTTLEALRTFERNLTIALSAAAYLTVLMLYAGFTRVGRISERAATIGVPCALAGTWFLCYYIIKSIEKS